MQSWPLETPPFCPKLSPVAAVHDSKPIHIEDVFSSAALQETARFLRGVDSVANSVAAGAGTGAFLFKLHGNRLKDLRHTHFPALPWIVQYLVGNDYSLCSALDGPEYEKELDFEFNAISIPNTEAFCSRTFLSGGVELQWALFTTAATTCGLGSPQAPAVASPP